jgi:hypothetical protein
MQVVKVAGFRVQSSGIKTGARIRLLLAQSIMQEEVENFFVWAF